MKTVAKHRLLLLLGLLVVLVMLSWSDTKSKFACVGQMKSDKVSGTELYIEITEYRPWVHLWSDSDGNANLEIPNTWVQYYDHTEHVGNQIQISDSSPTREIRGNFSELSKALLIDTAVGTFQGSCVPAT